MSPKLISSGLRPIFVGSVGYPSGKNDNIILASHRRAFYAIFSGMYVISTMYLQ